MATTSDLRSMYEAASGAAYEANEQLRGAMARVDKAERELAIAKSDVATKLVAAEKTGSAEHAAGLAWIGAAHGDIDRTAEKRKAVVAAAEAVK
jgi:hypothetical protein